MLWLWCRPVATAPIRPLAWEPPYAAGVALEKAKRQKEKKKFESCFVAQWFEDVMLSLHSFTCSFPVFTELLIFFLIFFVFLPFLGPLLQHMEVPRPGVESEL